MERTKEKRKNQVKEKMRCGETVRVTVEVRRSEVEEKLKVGRENEWVIVKRGQREALKK